MDYGKTFDKTRAEFERFLKERSSTWSFPQPLCESMRYSLFTGGKRFRPVMLLEAYKAFAGKTDETAFYLASAVEMLHTYSLVHDDLPCMDNDDYRRGKLTSHKKFGEDIAVLTGDALLNLAFETVFKAIEISGFSVNTVKAGAMFASLTGADGLIAGQVLDLRFSESGGDMSALNEIFRRKTCDLIAAAVLMGTISADADENDVAAMKEFAYNFGCAFQIADDIIDGGDADGCSVLKLVSEAEARKMLDEYTERAIGALDKVNADTKFFAEFALNAKTRVE